MVLFADMDTGKKKLESAEEYSEEVLLSNWTPQPELGLGLQEAMPAKAERSQTTQDVEAFMRAVYLSQE